ncbi:Acg family FMN-binding oxidoreductase [Saccharopolyspora rosea]|uniref:Acg family FMN-binding oxidoreductase n=1 Tax=Saccharopolyspora rosea TaxID=524884 RepID=A0ABW3FSE8_9PSEU|nr:nitroreductase family protein [Saccharopolyspora rosea]
MQGEALMVTFTSSLDLTPSQVEQVLRLAALAPSLHNAQPWRFRVLPHLIELHADPTRRLAAADPQDRELRLACGAALFNLRLALEHAGVRPVVTLLPRLSAATTVAEVRSGGRVQPDAETTALHEAIPRRHSHRDPFRDVPVSAEHRQFLRTAAHRERAWLHIVEPAERGVLEGLIHRAHRAQMADPRFRAELAAWTGRPDDAAEGVPARAAGPAPEAQDQWVHRDFSAGQASRSPGTRFEAHPLLVVLCTQHDDRSSHVEAGQAVERVWLTATSRGLVASMLSEVVEVPETREELRALLGQDRHPQALLRIGHGTPSVPAPRRDIGDLLLDTDDAS